MKKWTHLYIFFILSGISALSNLHSAFMGRFQEELFADVQNIPGLKDSIVVGKASMALQTNGVSKGLAVLLVILLLAAAFFLFKKRFEEATYVYMGYLFTTLLRATYTYVSSQGLLSLYTDSQMRSFAHTSFLVAYGLSIALFALYMGLTIFFLVRKSKTGLGLTASGTDL